MPKKDKNETKLQLSRLQLNVEEAEAIIEDRNNLLKLNLSPSANDNENLTALLGKITSLFKSLEDSFRVGGVRSKDTAFFDQFNDLVQLYHKLYTDLQTDPSIDVSSYKYEKPAPTTTTTNTTTTSSTATTSPTPAAKTTTATPSKSVRFKDTPEVEDTGSVPPMLSAQSTSSSLGMTPYTPYADNPIDAEAEAESDSNSTTDRSNLQMFAEHQQTMMRQDQDLEVLHQLISHQNRMGRDIDQELDEHMIILNDLELGVDNSELRLHRATRRLNNFRRMARENGSLVTIITLSVILILLLIVLN
ncbi:hypothetical protein LELG_00243 [Lodderomyces elongisporus NRRL YB-4239]|uniref:t-SNARE coiled-coil homology domain-containing protein n=1 Tax=Lodderomyces elongisporus (strain ATCC 11503 / CBS 2605 / JCM 1781 / NBRC 1676 / NRRL YB-4239) TaxID=379508 RepID=A5DSA7_LODEL|nr:hypothetical protein LELG_00243 [Lodderomyces elongisporus NRRL YB-4239]